jgi:LacI family repressor for deo operon, udp, cdd, tsx, nupC, and nupG
MKKSTGARRPTQAEIGRRLGVSQTLVGYALNGSGRVSKALREQIIAEAKLLGYTPNKAARALKSGQSQLVVLCLPQGISPFFGLILVELQRLAEKDGYDLVTTSGRLSQISQWPLDGVLVYDDVSLKTEQLKAAQGKHTMPIVAFGHLLHQAARSPFYSKIDYVGIELFDTSRKAVHSLVALGCRKLAFVAAQSIANPEDPRQRAFFEVVEECGIEGTLILVPDSQNLRQESKRVVAKALEQGSQFDGLFCGNDDVALGALRALRGAGLGVPSDVKVIGCDGLPDTSDAETPLSTIALPVEELCQEAWNTLMWRLNNPLEAPRHVALSTNIIWRESALEQALVTEAAI